MSLAFLHGLLLCFAFCCFDAEGNPQVITDAKSLQDPLPNITVEGREIKVNGVAVHLKGICWNPVPKGATHPEGADYGLTEPDTDIMVEAGINAVKLYSPIIDHSILDIFHRKGIWVIQVAYNWGGAPVAETVPANVNAVKDHPAILMYEVGNEWNYNKFYWDQEWDYTQARDAALEAIRLTKQLDPSRPVATNYGEVPRQEDMEILQPVLQEADVWGLNMYRGKDFRDAFSMWASLSEKPMYVGEYGCDAWNALINATDFEAQAVCTKELTEQIVANSIVQDPENGVTSGGFIFELADEWWKAGDPNTHDSGGVAPGGGPWPDLTFNEEWWGLMDTDRTEMRPAFYEYQAIGIPGAGESAAPINGPRNAIVIAIAVLGVVAIGTGLEIGSA